jgi:hypothetical protein
MYDVNWRLVLQYFSLEILKITHLLLFDLLLLIIIIKRKRQLYVLCFILLQKQMLITSKITKIRSYNMFFITTSKLNLINVSNMIDIGEYIRSQGLVYLCLFFIYRLGGLLRLVIINYVVCCCFSSNWRWFLDLLVYCFAASAACCADVHIIFY